MKPDNRSSNTSPTTATCSICEEKGTYPLKSAKPPHKTARGYVHHLHPR